MKVLRTFVLPFLSLVVFVIVLNTAPASGQEALKEADKLSQRMMELYEAGKYAEALPLAQKVLEIVEKILGLDHPAVATSLDGLASLHQDMGNYAQAEPLLHRALAIREKALGPGHPDVAASLNNLALTYKLMGDYAKAEPLYRRALGIDEKTLGPEHPDVALSLNNLAALYDSMGDYAKAEPLHRRALAIREKALGPEHPDVATSLSHLAGLYESMGDYDKAKPLHRRALAINEKALGQEHPDVALSLNNLAVLYVSIGDYAKAEPLLRRALAIREKKLGLEHPHVATSLNNLAALYQSMSDYAKAEPLLRRRLGITEKALGPDHPDVALSLNNLAVPYVSMGDYAKAEPLLRRALRIWEKALGPEHPDVALSLNNLAGLAALRRDYQSASSLFKKGFLIDERRIQNVFMITTEEKKLTFIRSISHTYLYFLSLVHQHLKEDQAAVQDGLELVLRRKGVVFDAQSRARNAVQGRLSESGRQQLQQERALRGELARLLMNRPEKLNADLYQNELASLHEQIEGIERHLAQESALIAKERKEKTVTLQEVSSALPKGSALVEFVKINDFDFSRTKWTASWRYLAFVLPAGGTAALVDLNDAGALEVQARQALMDIQALRETSAPEEIHRRLTSLKKLYTRIWAPLAPALGKTKKVLISPDGVLNLVPFAALVDDDGRFLVERYQLAYVTSGRGVVSVEGPRLQPERPLLLVANPAFDNHETAAATPTGSASVRSRDFQGTFKPLPGTAREAVEIPPLVLGSHAGKINDSVLDWERATETAVKSAGSPRILHLATHGFFLPDKALGLSEEKPAVRGQYENPLVRSGLAFAGANMAAQRTNGDDGLLTALEITGMDLHATDLVVLSACQTGVGEVQNGEGVFGLRRAFALAGAKNLLMSLWKVDDDVTAQQMKAFYTNLRTLPAAEALREAQLATIRELKAKNNGFAPPRLWAPFILQGAHALGP